MRLPTFALPLLLLLAACSGGDESEIGADGGADAGSISSDAGPDYTEGDWLFESDRVLQVSIALPDSDWDELRFQTRSVLDILGESCAQGPAPQAFTYRPATVTIEGETFSEVGVRKKGFLGSLSTDKPSLKIKMDEYVAGQHMSGLTRFTLNNAKQDPSYVNQCIAYDLFRAAGVPAPRCNFANVLVNGESLGLFVHVESVKKPYLRQYFESDDGNLYEGTLSDFRDGWTATFEKKTNESVADRPEIDEIAAALQLEGDAMREALDDIVDVEAFIRFWALESLVGHHDGYGGNSNNFYLYGSPDPANRNITFMPWGVDNLFGDGANGPEVALTRSLLPRSLFLHEPSRDAYVATMGDILDSAWDDSSVLAEIARMESMIRPFVGTDEEAAFSAGLDRIRTAVTGREAAFRAALDEIAQNTPSDLMEPLCFEKAGAIAMTFDTTYAAAGTATLEVSLDGGELAFEQLSSVAVPDEDNPDGAVVAIFADFADGSRALLFVPVPLIDFAPGTLVVDNGILLFFPPNSDEFDRAEFAAGTLTLDEASTVNGQPVIGSGTFDIWNTPFF